MIKWVGIKLGINNNLYFFSYENHKKNFFSGDSDLFYENNYANNKIFDEEEIEDEIENEEEIEEEEDNYEIRETKEKIEKKNNFLMNFHQIK